MIAKLAFIATAMVNSAIRVLNEARENGGISLLLAFWASLVGVFAIWVVLLIQHEREGNAS